MPSLSCFTEPKPAKHAKPGTSKPGKRRRWFRWSHHRTIYHDSTSSDSSLFKPKVPQIEELPVLHRITSLSRDDDVHQYMVQEAEEPPVPTQSPYAVEAFRRAWWARMPMMAEPVSHQLGGCYRVNSGPGKSLSEYISLKIEEDVDEELIELARLRVRALTYMNSIFGQGKDVEGYALLYLEPPRPGAPRLYWHGKIDQFGGIERNILCDRALPQATIPEVQRQYEMHISRLTGLMGWLQETGKAYRSCQRFANRERRTRWGTALRASLTHGNAGIKEARRRFEGRTYDHIVLKGILRLLHACEGILREADENFEANDWRKLFPERDPHKPSRPRWVEGQMNWTGLRSEDID